MKEAVGTIVLFVGITVGIGYGAFHMQENTKSGLHSYKSGYHSSSKNSNGSLFSWPKAKKKKRQY